MFLCRLCLFLLKNLGQLILMVYILIVTLYDDLVSQCLNHLSHFISIWVSHLGLLIALLVYLSHYCPQLFCNSCVHLIQRWGRYLRLRNYRNCQSVAMIFGFFILYHCQMQHNMQASIYQHLRLTILVSFASKCLTEISQGAFWRPQWVQGYTAL